MFQMPKWKCHKVVQALQIQSVDGDAIGFGEAWPKVIADKKMFSRFQPQPGDYYVVYEDGYASFSPKKAFEDGYTREA